MHLLIIYGSTEGHTRSIASYMAETAEIEGHKVDLINSAELRSPISHWFDGVIVGASVHQGHYQTSVRNFVLANKAMLEQVPSSFFSVSLAAAVQDKNHQREAKEYITAFEQETTWYPHMTASFAGAVRHAEYDYFKALVLKILAGQLGPGIIKGKDIVYTDWQAVKRFIEDFLKMSKHFVSIR